MLIPQHKILELADDEAVVRGWRRPGHDAKWVGTVRPAMQFGACDGS